ncbi:MAG: potassium/proton antiporter [Alphaproteobacteria bacterium]|nr:potassium/proton antiporter [Alphaproteobacteria bacterium]
MDFINLPILLAGLLLSISILTSLVSSRVGVPLILLFLCIGLTVGAGNFEVLQSLQHPRIVFFVGSVALAMILFDSGFHTPMKNYREDAKPALLMSTVGVAITALILSVFVYWLLDWGWLPALLLVSIISSTDSAAVFFLLRSRGLSLKERIKATLEIESGTNDPMAIFLTLIFAMLIKQHMTGEVVSAGFVVSSFFKQALVGAGAGFLLSSLMQFLVNKFHLETALYPIFVLGLALFGFAVSNLLGGSGFLTLYIAGLLVGNSRIQAYAQISKFQQTFTWLSQISMFVVLGLFVTFSGLLTVWAPAFAISVFLMFVARPIMVFLLLAPFKVYNLGEKIFISFVGLRGATSILLALIPMVFQLPYAEEIFNIIFVMVLISLAIQGFAIPVVGRWCGVTLPRLEKDPVKTEIDLPGLTDSSLVMYEITENTPVVQGEKIPKWAKPTLVIRNGVSYPAGARLRQLKKGDKVYIFVSSELQRPVLDRLFGGSGAVDKGTCGDFPIAPTTTFSELEWMYGLTVDKGIRDYSIAELFEQEFDGIEVGDRLSLGSVELVVHGLEDGVLTEVGIDIDPEFHHKNWLFRKLKAKKIKNN